MVSRKEAILVPARHLTALPIALAALLSLGCGAPAPPPKPPPARAEPAPPPQPPPPPEPEEIPSGKDCAKAQSECAGGVCLVTVKNGCQQPVTCDLEIVTNCKQGENYVKTSARERDTVPAMSEGKTQAAAPCPPTGEIVNTEIAVFKCN
ncbi:MAG: hypothetical protein HY744_27780 [Deltaproteobacteria bacterium]|nr:hypothetical protein [Deltaproteobacteria bacterium]